MTPKQISILRAAGSLSLCTAYLLITSGHVLAGVSVNMLGQVLLLPFGLKARAWDLLALSGFFITVNLRVLLGV